MSQPTQLYDIIKALEEIALGLGEEERESIMLQVERINDEMIEIENMAAIITKLADFIEARGAEGIALVFEDSEEH